MDEYDSPSKAPFIIGFLLILALAGFLFYKFNPLKNQSTIIPWSGSRVTEQPLSFNLDITNPDDQSLLFNSRLLVSGQTAPNAVVIINREENITEIDADKNGNFSENVTLDNGLNHITITAFNDQGNQKSVSRLVYYSQDQI
jgi:hypothetical protein